MRIDWARNRKTPVRMNLAELEETVRVMDQDGARHRRHPLRKALARVERARDRRMRSLRIAKGGTG
jgi:hypothetical protein